MSCRRPGSLFRTMFMALPRRGLGHHDAFQVAVHERDSDRAFAHGGGDPFDRAPAYVTSGEHPGQAGLVRQRRAAGLPAAVWVTQHIWTGENETPLIPREVIAEPVGPRLGADKDKQAI